ncbi:MAG: hypothetical protein HY054_08425 [Proteobacteria bacterium]|nr:hypothetical protein [Pseudomonadota bacterium]
MTSFDYVMALVSIVTSLALTHLIAGAVSLRNARSVRFSFVHALWMWSAFATTVGNWASN